MVRRWLPWIVLGVLVVGALAYAAWPRGVDESTAAHTHRIASELRCVDCEGLSVADSATSTAAATRADIASRIRHGESDAEIRQVYVDRYGETVLLKPSSDGLGVLVWALPIAALVLGAGGLVLALRRWQRQPRLVASEADEELVADERATAVNDERRRAQEEEREFLLRSLDDLESERAAGNIDDETYQRLHDDYTARAAITVRAMRDGQGDRRCAPSDRRPPRAGTGCSSSAGSIVFAVIAATTMAFALGARLPGDTITGNSQRDGSQTSAKDRLAALEGGRREEPHERRGPPVPGPVPSSDSGTSPARSRTTRRPRRSTRRTPSRSPTAAGSSGSRAIPTRRCSCSTRRSRSTRPTPTPTSSAASCCCGT